MTDAKNNHNEEDRVPAVPIYGKRPDVQEALLHLYLRLNGYFVTGLILHSDVPGNNATELDAIAVRHRFQREARREIGPSDFLTPKKTDVLICEVKSQHRPKQFNAAFREHDTRIEEALQWAGLFNPKGAREMARRLKPLLQPNIDRQTARTGIWDHPRAIRVRGLLCFPEIQNAEPNTPWMLDGSEMFGYIAKCLKPEFTRAACSVQYDFGAWGRWLAPLVRYFKELPADQTGQMNSLYQFLEKERVLPKAGGSGRPMGKTVNSPPRPAAAALSV